MLMPILNKKIVAIHPSKGLLNALKSLKQILFVPSVVIQREFALDKKTPLIVLLYPVRWFRQLRIFCKEYFSSLKSYSYVAKRDDLIKRFIR